MLQGSPERSRRAPMFEGLAFDPFALADDGLGPAEVGVCGRHVVQALVISLVIVVLDERFDLAFEVAGQEVLFQEDAVLQGLVPALDLALVLRMERGAAHMAHALGFNVIGQFASDVARASLRLIPRINSERSACRSAVAACGEHGPGRNPILPVPGRACQ